MLEWTIVLTTITICNPRQELQPSWHLFVQRQQWKHWNGLLNQWRLSGVLIVNFEQISHIVLVFLMLTLNIYVPIDSSLKSTMNVYKASEQHAMKGYTYNEYKENVKQ